MKKILFSSFIFFLIFFSSSENIYGQSNSSLPPPPTPAPFYKQIDASMYISQFKNMQILKNLDITIPTLIKFTPPDSYKSGLLLVENETNTVQPFSIMEEAQKVVKKASSNLFKPNEENLVDDNFSSYVEYQLDSAQSVSRVTIKLDYDYDIRSNTLALFLKEYSSSPKTIQIAASTPDNLVVAARPTDGLKILFPSTSAKVWYITFTYDQPLIISEIAVADFSPIYITSLYFLARPNLTYTLYSDSDAYLGIPLPEGGQIELTSNANKKIPFQEIVANPLYKKADSDSDGIKDASDNCPNIMNPDQKDINYNRVGDVCDDFDQDGILNYIDNCPDHPNRSQIDTDGDKIGDHCDKEESRLSEQFAFLPWVGLGAGFIVVIGIFAITVKRKPV